MTNKGRIKGNKKVSFNIVDILIVAVAIILLAYFIYCVILGNDLSSLGAKRISAEYTLKIENASEEYYNMIFIGDTVKSSDGTVLLGKVIGKSYENTSDSITIFVTVSSDLYLKSGTYSIKDKKISEGAVLSIRFPGYSPSKGAECVLIKEL